MTAYAVVDEINLDTLCLFLPQKFRKFVADLVIINEKGFKIYMVFGVLYRFEHGGVRGVIIDQECDLVAACQRRFAP